MPAAAADRPVVAVERFGVGEYGATVFKRLKGLEPSTFCMASRRSSQLSYSRAGAIIRR